MDKEVNGVRVHYSLNEGSGSNVLLLHGWGCSGKMMQPVSDALGSSFRVLIPDLPGHGESGEPPVPWGVPEYAECVLALLNENGFTPCHIVAHSFGCRIAAWLAAFYPETVGRLVFTGAAGIRPKPSEEARKRSDHYRKLSRAAKWISKIPLLSGAAGIIQEQLRKRYGSADYNALNPEMRKTFVKIVNQDLSDLYGRIQAGTLLLWGDQDTETPLWMAREMERKIPDSGLVILEGGSHFAYLEQIGKFNLITKQFLKGDA